VLVRGPARRPARVTLSLDQRPRPPTLSAAGVARLLYTPRKTALSQVPPLDRLGALQLDQLDQAADVGPLSTPLPLTGSVPTDPGPLARSRAAHGAAGTLPALVAPGSAVPPESGGARRARPGARGVSGAHPGG
jgi:hypothetical protein